MFIPSIDQGPIRPPSEAQSLLLRITHNCPWNRCAFCHIYKGRQFSARTVEAVVEDIETVRALADEIRDASWKHGVEGGIHPERLHPADGGRTPEDYRSVWLWLRSGAKSVFLQDADNLAIQTADLSEILRAIRTAFPSVERITTYARSRTLSKKPLRELEELRAAGLTRIHTGMESGHDSILKQVQKGTTAAELIDAGRKVRQAGISLSEYIMPGLGGTALWREHARETAAVLNAINPDYIRIRTLKALPSMPLFRKIESGEMQLQHEDAIILEIRLLIENLRGITSRVVSDHSLNLLEEVEGELAEAKDSILSVIDRYLNLSETEKAHFRLGRRTCFYRTLGDRHKPGLRAEVDRILYRIESRTPGGLDHAIAEMMNSFI